MSNVINIFTRKPVTEMLASKETGEALIQQLLEFDLRANTNPFMPDIELVSNLIRMIEANTGASRYDVMERLYQASQS